MKINKDFVLVVVFVEEHSSELTLHPGQHKHTHTHNIIEAESINDVVTALHMKINDICDEVTLRNCQAQRIIYYFVCAKAICVNFSGKL